MQMQMQMQMQNITLCDFKLYNKCFPENRVTSYFPVRPGPVIRSGRLRTLWIEDVQLSAWICVQGIRRFTPLLPLLSHIIKRIRQKSFCSGETGWPLETWKTWKTVPVV